MPGLVVLPLLALAVAFALAAALSLRPWEDDAVSPNLLPAPDLGVSIGDAVALPDPVVPAVAQGAVAARPTPGAASPSGGSGGGARAAFAVHIAPAVVASPARAAPQPAPPGPEGPQPAPPASAPAQQPAATPPAAEPAPPRIVADIDGPRGGWRSVVDGGASPAPVAVIQVREGEARALAFSFLIVRMAYGEPGAENSILRLRGEAGEEAALGLQLWDDPAADPTGALRGVWASGEGAGGERFLAAAPEGAWHRAVVHLDTASGDGFYELYLDGEPIDARGGLALLAEGEAGRIELGLQRDQELVRGSSEVRFDDVRLGDSLTAVTP